MAAGTTIASHARFTNREGDIKPVDEALPHSKMCRVPYTVLVPCTKRIPRTMNKAKRLQPICLMTARCLKQEHAVRTYGTYMHVPQYPCTFFRSGQHPGGLHCLLSTVYKAPIKEKAASFLMCALELEYCVHLQEDRAGRVPSMKPMRSTLALEAPCNANGCFDMRCKVRPCALRGNFRHFSRLHAECMLAGHPVRC